MERKTMHIQLALVLVIALALAGALAADDQALDDCPRTCGGVPILYPFGVGSSVTTGQKCFLEESFEVTCNKSTLYWGNIPVLNISLGGQVEMTFFVSQVCYNSSIGKGVTEGNEPWQTSIPGFTISSKENKFITIGCDTFGYLNSLDNGQLYSTGCLTRCYGNITKIDGNCSGIGCCQMDIPPGMRNISLQAFSFENFNRSFSFNNCSYSFVAKNGNYTFSRSHLEHLPFETVPMVVDWTVGNERCEASQRRGANACKNNSDCDDEGIDYGYRCSCRKGYEGNPYHPNGCKDIDECKTSQHTCISEHNCLNIDGSHKCFCPKGQSGNGTKEGGCHRKDVITKFVIGASAGFMALFAGTSWLYLIYQKQKLIKLKEKFFRQNGGVILQQRLSTRENSAQNAQIFTAEQLKKATNNYDESLIIGRGGYGTVFKGFLTNNSVVAVKKSKVVDQSQIEQFINEVIILSQINHRNVVKLLGCCLETEVPLLVYEFVNNGTLLDYLNNERKATNVSWKPV